jgi:hypothetical protein
MSCITSYFIYRKYRNLNSQCLGNLTSMITCIRPILRTFRLSIHHPPRLATRNVRQGAILGVSGGGTICSCHIFCFFACSAVFEMQGPKTLTRLQCGLLRLASPSQQTKSHRSKAANHFARRTLFTDVFSYNSSDLCCRRQPRFYHGQKLADCRWLFLHFSKVCLTFHIQASNTWFSERMTPSCNTFALPHIFCQSRLLPTSIANSLSHRSTLPPHPFPPPFVC